MKESVNYLVVLPLIKEYLREYLHIPAELVPLTHRKAPRPQREGPPGGGLRRRDDAYRPPRREGGDGEYRRRDDAGGERPRFGGGFGRGRVAE
jgi:small subunit ribosomal protein S10e